MLQLAEGRRSRSPQHSSLHLKNIEAILDDVCHSGRVCPDDTQMMCVTFDLLV